MQTVNTLTRDSEYTYTDLMKVDGETNTFRFYSSRQDNTVYYHIVGNEAVKIISTGYTLQHKDFFLAFVKGFIAGRN